MSGDPTFRVYVDARPVDVPKNATVLDAVELADPALGVDVRSGERTVTDSRGLPIDCNSPVHGGAILRVIPARKSAN